MAKTFRNVNGVLLLDKPIGESSNYSLQRVKRILQAKKAGHAGTLDVLASGMLPISFGEATKFSQFLLGANKIYYAVAKLGSRTTTGDREGEVVETRSIHHLTRERIASVLQTFEGEIEQIPPMYSALKQQGKRLYELAREGVEVERKSRKVIIYAIQWLDWKEDCLSLKVHCSKGTYIRTLVEDIGQALNCAAHTWELRRLSVDPFREEQMVTFEQLEQQALPEIERQLLPMDVFLTNMPVVVLESAQAIALQQGRQVLFCDPGRPDTLCRLYNAANVFIGIGLWDGRGYLLSYRLCSYPRSCREQYSSLY